MGTQGLQRAWRRRMAVAVLTVPVAVAMAGGAAWLRAETSVGGWALLFWVPILGILLGTSMMPRRTLVAFATFFTAFVAVAAADRAVEHHVFQGRAEATSCLVRDVDRRVEYSTSTDANGTTTSHTNVYYDYDLACDGGRPTSMTLGHRPAGRGERLDVAFDPEGRLTPRPVDDVTDGGTALWVSLSCLGATVVLRGADVFADRRRW
ncbi:hypothetical protein GCM10023205_83890 [Yinghuangia aomiensis]|uniref:DUF3592 domain-containing protein n=1 Tax=Yinghuangia aomiensis TaxID=676205 RepID=A0ABP9IGX0_9ACTN